MYIVISKKKRIGDICIKQVQACRYFGCILTADRKSDNEIGTRIGQAKEAWENLRKILRNGKMCWNNEKSEGLLCGTHPLIWQCTLENLGWGKQKGYRKGCSAEGDWTFHVLHVSNMKALTKMATKWTFIFKIRIRISWNFLDIPSLTAKLSKLIPSKIV